MNLIEKIQCRLGDAQTLAEVLASISFPDNPQAETLSHVIGEIIGQEIERLCGLEGRP